ncbi:MAG: F0F1 ATP synthase subunit epsilon [Rhodospirillales bacterium]|nr:F0F1 ATP synthase subunit epsilon [Rhodospirillales bacterium]MDH3909973.1 F0F1 ATP synthase subunit epsilon [Rhodospirillales bacterium]MDH3919063.1 F0F1 ATP synthase subunit epsilon [Rhodospirillales bacterium]MDH3969537.1 F0F1 ATP synthase subunit epsilon [Rhodospirillales bacterium]
MIETRVAFELVSPERLLLSESVDMVVVPGAEGDFGVLVRHAPLVSGVRPGVISVYNGGQVTERIFVAGGFAEVTPSRCTVLAEQAMPVAEIDRMAAEQQLKDAREDLADAKDDDERDAAARQIAVAEAMIQASAS